MSNNSSTRKDRPHIPPINPLPADYDAFIACLDEKERKLMEIAKDKLGSSFFVQWCHAYVEWKKNSDKKI